MQYRLTSFNKYSEVRSWVNSLDDPLVQLETQELPDIDYHGVYGATWVASVVASGPGETMLLLKYGNVLDAI